MLIPLLNLLDTQGLYPVSIESEEDVGIPTIGPHPVPPPRPSNDGAFIWGGMGGGGGGWPDHREIECAQREWVADQIAYREHLRAMGMLDQGGMVRRARRLPRHTYVSARRPTRPRTELTRPTRSAMGSSSSSSRSISPKRRVSFVGELANAAFPHATNALAKRHRSRNGAPDPLVCAGVGVIGFIGTRVITNVAGGTGLRRTLVSSTCAVGTMLFTPRSWQYRQPLIVGASVASIDDLLRLLF